MSNCQIIIGSPRKKGNTSLMADLLIQHAENMDYKFEKSFLYDIDMKPCKDCRVCKKGEEKCLVKDGMQDLYNKLEQSDTIIVGTPIYWFSPTAQTKLFVDRLRPYYGSKRLKGKKLGLLLPAGVGAKDCDLTIIMFKRICEALEIEYIGEVIVEAYDEGDVHNHYLDSDFDVLVKKMIS